MSIGFQRAIYTVDSHTEGNPTRVIIGGVPSLPGATLLDKRTWLSRNDDGLRRLLNFEPRGSDMMCSVLLLPPETAQADFSVIIMEPDEYVTMCGHCIIGTATTVVATGMIKAVGPVTTVRFDTPAGLVTCDVKVAGGIVQSVSVENVESFLLTAGAILDVAEIGRITVDVAYGGDFYCFVDADAIGLDLNPHNNSALVNSWRNIRRAVGEQLTVVHPERPDIDVCYEVLFASERKTSGDYKQTIVSPPGALDRSPCGTGTAARVAQLFTKGKIALNEPKKFEGVLGTYFTGTAIRAEQRRGVTYVVPRVEGRAWITGFHHFVLDPDDPFPEGFRVGFAPTSGSRL
jgi:proline racemase